MPETKKWLISITVVFGAFMAVMDISVVNVALPHMMGTFSEDLSTITWVATGYSIAEIIMITMAGWFSTLIGRKRLYLLSFAVFTLGSILCGTAVSFHQMMVYRIIQGLGGGALVPVSQAILKEAFGKEEQGMAMAIFGMGVVLAPAVGPIFGGWLTDHYGWPWIFYINVPVSIVGILMVMAFVEDPAYLKRGVNKIDWQGIVLLTLSLTSMQFVLERGQEKNWLESKEICAGLLITLVTGLGLVLWELKAQEPIMNLRVLKNRALAVGSFVGLIFGMALFGTTFILPQFTQNLLGYSAFQAGIVLAPRAVMLLIFMPVAGQLYRRFDVRGLLCFAILVLVWSYYDLSGLSLSAGFRKMVPTLVIMGIGMPFMFVPLSGISLSTVSRTDMIHATSFYTLSRRIGGNIGYAVVATLVARGQQVHRADLVAHVTPYNPNLSGYLHQLSGHLSGQGAMAFVDRVIIQQATMLAYNDVSMIFGLLFLAVLPFVFLLPSQHAQG
ncbi:DHA2 family efflux MFS transporter permease subunit [Desulfospira joergensenii]|uniref:DHA2 family efflux MFS transporter permease subunit n=1 Tax=Desulfospira joergensenii TaxID=53329 RepID=UPI0003B3C917|nr:DHA2 family efflux MFS transporter permease subunit [Desulfospira joergensenii]